MIKRAARATFAWLGVAKSPAESTFTAVFWWLGQVVGWIAFLPALLISWCIDKICQLPMRWPNPWQEDLYIQAIASPKQSVKSCREAVLWLAGNFGLGVGKLTQVAFGLLCSPLLFVGFLLKLFSQSASDKSSVYMPVPLPANSSSQAGIIKECAINASSLEASNFKPKYHSSARVGPNYEQLASAYTESPNNSIKQSTPQAATHSPSFSSYTPSFNASSQPSTADNSPFLLNRRI